MVPFRDEDIDRVEALLLVQRIKESPGGHRLSMEMIIFLAVVFEDCYLPGPGRVGASALRRISEESGK